MYARILVPALLVLLSGCAGGRAGVVALYVEAIPAGQQEWRQLSRGHTWHSGDRYTLRVEVSRAAYVYVARLPPRRPLTLLHPAPNEAEQQLQPGLSLQLPVGKPWFELDDDVGEENLRIIAALQRLSPAQVEQEARRPGAVQVREPPPIRDARDRATSIARAWIEAPGRAGGGVGIVRLTFRHE